MNRFLSRSCQVALLGASLLFSAGCALFDDSDDCGCYSTRYPAELRAKPLGVEAAPGADVSAQNG